MNTPVANLKLILSTRALCSTRLHESAPAPAHTLAILLVACAALLAGCATQPETLQTQPTKTLQGTPVKITRIPLSISATQRGQVAAGYIWATNTSLLMGHSTVRIDPKTYQAVSLTRPMIWGFADLLVDEKSIWFSDGMMRLNGSGELRRYDIKSNQLMATIEAAGSPVTFGDGAIWAYNPAARTITGIDANTNQVRTRIDLPNQGWRYHESFTFADGSIWQSAYRDDVSASDITHADLLDRVVRRIDPYSKKVLAEIPIGNSRTAGDIGFVGGSIWIVGVHGGFATPIAIRIDVRTNKIVAEIPMVRSKDVGWCPDFPFPSTPVLFRKTLWISTSCRGRQVLMQISPKTNQVIDELVLPMSGNSLMVSDDALLMLAGDSLIKIEF